MESSAYTTLRLNRGRTLVALAALGVGVALATNGLISKRFGHYYG